MQKSASTVRIEKTNGRYSFVLNGKKFLVKGAGIDSSEGDYYRELKEAGGNCFRTWRADNAEAELEAAAENGLMVALCLELGKEMHGFDYTDKNAVGDQFERVKKEVNKYKNHPNLLCWIVGNELNLLVDASGNPMEVNPAVYDSVAKVIAYIKANDPNHPTTTTFAGIHKGHVQTAIQKIPQIDFLSFQVYGELTELKERVNMAKIDLPYLVTEFGPTGHWEVPQTSWGREIEEPSALKAIKLKKRMKAGFSENTSGLCMGSFAFLWGRKQERTPTWYSIFLKNGAKTAMFDELTNFWMGKYPQHKAPAISGILINEKAPEESLMVAPGQICIAAVRFPNSEEVKYTFTWELMREVASRSQGGAFEQEPETLPLSQATPSREKLAFTAPKETGEFRLFVYVHDRLGKVGTANFPFLVK